MRIEPRKLKGIFEITPAPHRDVRGYMVRLFDADIFRQAGLETIWVQESRSHTRRKHTLRGLHVSLPPALEGKTITAMHGQVFWVVVDVRRGSETFGQWDGVVLSAERHNTLCAQRGFAHGCLSLTDECDLLLRADTSFVEQNGTGIIWDDPELGIDWGLNGVEPLVSERDRRYPGFKQFKERYGGVSWGNPDG